jgi:DUF4097 and DUF4098 domain-containing protein YvlB
MEKGTKMIITLALSLIVVGGILFVLALSSNGWRFQSSNYESAEYEITDTFQGISINIDTADITFLPSTNGMVTASFYEHKHEKHQVSVIDDSLSISVKNEKKWWENLFNISSPKITIYLPEGAYGALKIDASTGDISIPSDFSFESIDVSLSTGDTSIYAKTNGSAKIEASTGDVTIDGMTPTSLGVTVSTGEVSIKNVACSGDISLEFSTGDVEIIDTVCGKLSANGSTGDMLVKNTVASESFNFDLSTGSIDFDRSDANEIYINVTTGDVKGTLLSSKIFFVNTDTGKVSVPESTTGGKFKCETSTGDVIISFAN